jgi:hypothetical protein
MGEAATKFAHQLTGLSGGEDYRFRVKATYQDGTEFFGAQNFSTPPYPRISNLRFEPTKNSPSAGVNVTWDTNVKTSSAVNLTNNEGKGKSVSSAEMNKKHSLTIEGLTDQTEYQLIASGRDEYGNQAVSDIQTFTTQEDSRPPIITNTKLETSIIGIGAESKAQIVVSWQTDEPATSQVEYGIGVGGGSYQSSTMEDSSLTKTHTVIISELDPARTYHLRAVSKDGAGNLTKGDDNVIITGKKKDSVLDIILEKLRDTFGFLGNIRETLGV